MRCVNLCRTFGRLSAAPQNWGEANPCAFLRFRRSCDTGILQYPGRRKNLARARDPELYRTPSTPLSHHISNPPDGRRNCSRMRFAEKGTLTKVPGPFSSSLPFFPGVNRPLPDSRPHWARHSPEFAKRSWRQSRRRQPSSRQWPDSRRPRYRLAPRRG